MPGTAPRLGLRRCQASDPPARGVASPSPAMPKPTGHESVTEGLDDANQETLDEIRARAEVEAKASPENEYGRPGQPFDRSSPFFVGFVGALGVACAFAIAYLFVQASEVLVLLGLAFFLAVGLDPAVR